METAITTLFWALVALLFYVYAGYPLLLWLVRTMGGVRRVGCGIREHAVTMLISAFNEEPVIGRKIANTLELDYPRDLLQVIVISDASADRTDEIVRGFSEQGVLLLRMPAQGGKSLGLNAAMTQARGEVVVFSDANAMYAVDALRMLVAPFTDSSVGAVVGESGYVAAGSGSEANEGLYWRYETAIKRLESEVGSVVGGDGAIYAIRRELFEPLRVDALSDFVNPLQIVRRGYRCVYEPRARSFEHAAGSYAKEFRRKVRIVNRAWRALFSLRGLMNPMRHGLFSLKLISHKLIRWLVPVFLVGMLAANAILLGSSPLYVAIFSAQILFYLLALVGYILRYRKGLPAVLSVPFYFCLVNIACVRAIIDVARGRTYATWQTARVEGS